jgi:pimeloyl-ACP methyl ester carboxylesterase
MQLVLAVFLFLALVAPPVSSVRAQPVYSGLAPLTGVVFGDPSNTMVVFLHGDVSSGGPADYMYSYARNLASSRDVLTAAILRPGYWDSQGHKSRGSNNRRQDHYTQDNNDLVVETIEELKNEHHITRVIAVGHSGGAAQLGVIIAQKPNLIDVAILVSCPCDLDQWRAAHGHRPWKKSVSPSTYIKGLQHFTDIYAFTGADDKNTFPDLAEMYYVNLIPKSFGADFKEIKGGNHYFSTLAFEVMAKIHSLL